MTVDEAEFRRVSDMVIRQDAVLNMVVEQQRKNTDNIAMLISTASRLEHDIKGMRANVEGVLQIVTDNKKTTTSIQSKLDDLVAQKNKYFYLVAGGVGVGAWLLSNIISPLFKWFGAK